LWFAVPNLVAVMLIAEALPGDWNLVILLALLHYEWVHYIAHIPYLPRMAFGRWMKKYHLWHHFKNEHLWFGVSNPSMDFLYRTYRSPDAVARSTTARVLHPEDEV
jgi:4-hydroxysphinganine ceramide fatty acyl 2-hydroxylase